MCLWMHDRDLNVPQQPLEQYTTIPMHACIMYPKGLCIDLLY